MARWLQEASGIALGLTASCNTCRLNIEMQKSAVCHFYNKDNEFTISPPPPPPMNYDKQNRFNVHVVKTRKTRKTQGSSDFCRLRQRSRVTYLKPS